MKIRVLAVLVCLALFVQVALAAPKQSKPYTPKPGSSERKAIMNALRKPVMKEFKKKIIFTKVDLKVKDGWAFTRSIAVDSKGIAVGEGPWKGADCVALLRKQKGLWKVLIWGIETDAAVEMEALKKYPQAPKSLFPAELFQEN